MRPVVALIVALALASVVVVGCGGGGDSTAITTSSLSKKQFIDKANEICQEAREIALAYKPKNESGPEKQVVTATIHKGVLPAIQGAMEEVRELGAPEGDEAKIEAIVAGNEEMVEKAEGKSFSALGDMETLFLPTAEKARSYGIDRCGY
jgi:hypothetical protein